MKLQLTRKYFTEEHCKNNQYVKFNGYIHQDSFILVSDRTGVEKVFTLDKELSAQLAQDHEYWDGEESHHLYTSDEAPGVICEVWHTPYDLRKHF